MPAPGTSGKMPVSKKTVTGVLSSTAQIRAASDSGMIAMMVLSGILMLYVAFLA